MTTVGFIAIGTPAPQGSKRHVGGGRMIESSKHVAPWRDTVTAAALKVRPAEPLDRPLGVRLVFTVARPKSTPKRERYPSKRPDIDKLTRSTLDAITAAGIWHDDGQAQRVDAAKVWPDRLVTSWALPVPGVVAVVSPSDEPFDFDAHQHLLDAVDAMWRPAQQISTPERTSR